MHLLLLLFPCIFATKHSCIICKSKGHEWLRIQWFYRRTQSPPPKLPWVCFLLLAVVGEGVDHDPWVITLLFWGLDVWSLVSIGFLVSCLDFAFNCLSCRQLCFSDLWLLSCTLCYRWTVLLLCLLQCSFV